MEAKFEIKDLLAIGMTIVVLVIGISYGLDVTDDIQTDFKDAITATSVTNESVVITNATATALANSAGNLAISCSAVRNISGDTSAIGTANYTCDSTGITLTDVGGLETNGSVYVDYTYKIPNTAYNATGDGIEAVAKIPAKLPTVVTIVRASVVIGILITYLVVRVR